jgi:molecular chaperone GrpE
MTEPEVSRDVILRRFEQLLDSALAGEEPPAGIDPAILSVVAEGPVTKGNDADGDRQCDSYALWAAITSLTQEVKLQGRAFQELNHTLEAQTSRLLDEVRAVYAERERNLQREAERRVRREVLSALIDLRDRLSRGRESARARVQEKPEPAKAGWMRRFFPETDGTADESVGALMRGYELGLERLDQTLDEFNVREIRCEGEIFDPRRMNAIESQESAIVPEGSILEVYRSGYEWNGEVFRPAQVKVSRAPVAKTAGKTGP